MTGWMKYMIIKGHSVAVFLPFMLMLQLATACSLSAQPIQGERWVIFPAEQAQELGIGDWFVEDGQTTEYWTPSESDVLILENGLGPFLQNNPDRFNEQKAPIWERLDGYNRQYIGIILAGKKVIYANYFCDSVQDWRKDFVFVMDGGDCFFQFKYDVDSAEFFDLQVNGNA
jgi:hypothetical protein